MTRSHDLIDEAFEDDVRTVLHAWIVPPPAPEHVRYRVLAMDGAIAPRRWPSPGDLGVPRALRRGSPVARFAYTFVAIVALVAGGLVAWNTRSATVSTATPSSPVWDAGRMMIPQTLPGGGAYTYVDGRGLFVTKDFGRTWSGPRQVPVSDNVRDHLWDIETIEFADVDRGWMTQVTNGPSGSQVTLFRTVDGGRSWHGTNVQAFGEAASERDFVGAQEHFRDARHGWLLVGRVTEDPTAATCRRWESSDGGASWTRGEAASCVGLFSGVHWSNPMLGYSSSAPDSAAGTVWITQDGGMTWTKASLPGTWNAPMPFLLIAGSGELTLGVQEGRGSDMPSGTLLRSTDGGTTWVADHDISSLEASASRGAMGPVSSIAALAPKQWIGLGTGPSDVCGPDVQSCRASTSGWLEVSADEGRTWTEKGPKLWDPSALAFWDELHGLVIGRLGPLPPAPADTPAPPDVLLVTDDGGQTWQAARL